MKTMRALLVAILVGAPGAWLGAQNEPAPAAATDSGVETDAMAPSDVSDASDAASAIGAAAGVSQPQPANADEDGADDWEMPALPPGFDDDIFIPTEEVAADEEVVFPVDI